MSNFATIHSSRAPNVTRADEPRGALRRAAHAMQEVGGKKEIKAHELFFTRAFPTRDEHVLRWALREFRAALLAGKCRTFRSHHTCARQRYKAPAAGMKSYCTGSNKEKRNGASLGPTSADCAKSSWTKTCSFWSKSNRVQARQSTVAGFHIQHRKTPF